MSKHNRRRRNRRHVYLVRLAQENPKKFRREWTKRLESWAHEAKYRAEHITDDVGRPVLPSFQLVQYSLEELSAYGDDAIKLEAYDTKDIMIDVCCRAVAEAVDPRMYRLSNMNKKRNKGG